MHETNHTHSIELAEERARCQAKTLTAALRKATRVYLHGDRVAGQPSYADAFTFDVTFEMGDRRGGYEPARMRVTVPGQVHGGHTDATRESEGGYLHETESFRPDKGFWSLLAAEDRLRDALASVPPDADVWLDVYLDAGSNDLTRRAKLHSDRLSLCARWMRGGKKHERTFILDTQVSAHNSARFGSPSG